MLKNILKAAIVVTFILGVSFSGIAQTVTTNREVNREIKQNNESSPLATLGSVDLGGSDKKIETQVQRYARDYNLTEEQQKELITILTDFETQSNELRNKLNSLTQERTEKIDNLLTDEQKTAKEQLEKDRRTKLLERRNTDKQKDTKNK